MDKKISIEIAVGIIVIIAVIIGGSIWLNSQKENSARIQVTGSGIKATTSGEGNIQIQGDAGKINANESNVNKVSGTQVDNSSGTQSNSSGNVQFHVDDNSASIKTKNGSVNINDNGISASGNLKKPSVKFDGSTDSVQVKGPLGGSFNFDGDTDSVQVQGPDTGN